MVVVLLLLLAGNGGLLRLTITGKKAGNALVAAANVTGSNWRGGGTNLCNQCKSAFFSMDDTANTQRWSPFLAFSWGIDFN